jgi:hypothetical protein
LLAKLDRFISQAMSYSRGGAAICVRMFNNVDGYEHLQDKTL